MKKIVLGVLVCATSARAMQDNFSERLNKLTKIIEDYYNENNEDNKASIRVSIACTDIANFLKQLDKDTTLSPAVQQIYQHLIKPYQKLAELVVNVEQRPKTFEEFKAKLQEFSQPEPRSWMRRISFSNKKP